MKYIKEIECNIDRNTAYSYLKETTIPFGFNTIIEEENYLKISASQSNWNKGFKAIRKISSIELYVSENNLKFHAELNGLKVLYRHMIVAGIFLFIHLIVFNCVVHSDKIYRVFAITFFLIPIYYVIIHLYYIIMKSKTSKLVDNIFNTMLKKSKKYIPSN